MNPFLVEPRPKVQALLDKHSELCLSSMFVGLATATNIALQTANFKKNVAYQYHKKDCQAHICVTAKLAKIVLDKQNFKCLPNNAFRLPRAVKVNNSSDCYSHQYMQ